VPLILVHLGRSECNLHGIPSTLSGLNERRQIFWEAGSTESSAGVQIEAVGISSGSTASKVPVTTANATTDGDGAFTLFVDPGKGDYHIRFQSPCRASGDNSAAAGLHDLEGDPRIAYGTIDIGADEFYTHLYVTGDTTPGGAIQGKLVGLPGTNPVGLFIGSGVLPYPMPTMWGEYRLQAPWVLLGPLGSIPSNGVMILPATLPMSPPAPYDVPMQALIGLNADSLTNVCVLQVR